MKIAFDFSGSGHIEQLSKALVELNEEQEQFSLRRVKKSQDPEKYSIADWVVVWEEAVPR